MKIAISINTSWNIFNFRKGLIKELQKKGHEIYAIAPYDEYTILLENEGVNYIPISINSKGTDIRQDIYLLREYYRIFKRIKPDLYLSYTIKPNIYGTYAAKVLGISVINNLSGLGTLFIKKSISTYISYLLYKLAFLKSDWVFFQNPDDLSIFLKKKLINKKRTSILPGSGVNLEVFNFERTKNLGKRVLFVGRLIGDKGIREFFEAGKLIRDIYPDVKFQIVGELGYDNKTALTKHELEEWLKLPQFEYIGKSDDMSSILKETDIMVLPSYREGLSKSLIEACAMRLPIVTTNVPGCRDVVEDGYNGYLCAPKDANHLMKKIMNIKQILVLLHLVM